MGCGGDEGGSGPGESPDLGAATEAMITAADGGEVALAEAGVKLSIPAGALAEDTMISAEVVSRSGLPDAAMLAGNVVEFGPDGLTFEQPVTLELEVGDTNIPENAVVSIAWYDDEADAWVDLPGSEIDGGKVTAQTTHFTIFAIRFVVNADGEVVQEGGECSEDFNACGGDIEGTWRIVAGCANAGAAFANAGAQCAGASISLGVDITGDIVIGGGMITGTLEITSEITQVMPKSCIGGMCPAADPEDPEDFVFEDKGDTCEGTQSEAATTELDGMYMVEGGMFVMEETDAMSTDSDTTEYCVTGNTLVVNSVNEEGIVIRWTAERR